MPKGDKLVRTPAVRLRVYEGVFLIDPFPEGLKKVLTWKYRHTERHAGRRPSVSVIPQQLWQETKAEGCVAVPGGWLAEVTKWLYTQNYEVEFQDYRAQVPELGLDFGDPPVCCDCLGGGCDTCGGQGISPAPNSYWRLSPRWQGGQAEVVRLILRPVQPLYTGVVGAATAFGKSHVARTIARTVRDRLRTLIVVHEKSPQKQMVAALEEGGLTPGVLNGEKKFNPRWDLCVSTIKSTPRIPDDWPQLLLADECHKYATFDNAAMILRFIRARRFGFSATAFDKPDGTAALVKAMFGDMIFERSYQEAQEAGDVAYITTYVYDIRHCREVRTSWEAQWERLNVWANAYVNDKVAIVTRACAEKGPTLVLVKTTEHVLHLWKLLPEATLVFSAPSDEDRAWFTTHGLPLPETLEDSEVVRQKMVSGEIRLVIANVKWDTGMDIPNLKYLVYAGQGSTYIGNAQRRGRGGRTDNGQKMEAVMIDFLIHGIPRLRNAGTTRIGHYEKLGSQVEHRDDLGW